MRENAKHTVHLHPGDPDLAAFAGGDAGFFRGLTIGRHVDKCEACQEMVAEFRDLRVSLAALPGPELKWDALAAEMSANIRLGLEAGECVRENRSPRFTVPHLAVAFAAVILLVGAGLILRSYQPEHALPAASAPAIGASSPLAEFRSPVLESSIQGISLRSGRSSFAFLNRTGQTTSQTVSAEGAMRSRDIDGDTGSVTIRDVYLQ